jgi:hypothetical protein
MGRWSYIRILDKNGRNIIILSAYQVCQQQEETAGDWTAFAQQLLILQQNGRDGSPRKAFLEDLDKQIKEWINQDYKIVLSGDFNEQLGAGIHGFTIISAKWVLVEVIQHFHGGLTDKPPTYAHGTKCLDYVFCTPNLISSVKRCGILLYSEIINSDHRAIYVDFHTQTLMGGDLALLSTTPVRILLAHDSIASTKYVEAIAAYMEDHRVLHR